MENDKTVFEKRDFRKTVCPLFGVHFIKTMDVESPESAERKGLTSMLSADTILAEQSRAEQSRAEANCALFAAFSYGAFETEYNIRDG